MERDNKQVSRKTFLSWGLGISALLAIPAFLRPAKRKKQAHTVKMLTQDGRLVVIDVANIPEKKERIQPKDIPAWVNKKKSSL